MARRWLAPAAGLAVLCLAAGGAVLADAWSAFGGTPAGARRARMEASPQWAEGRFVNPQPMWNDLLGMTLSWTRASAHGSPDSPLPVLHGDGSRFSPPPDSGLRITWLGHSTQLIELDGAVVLTDPIFGGRASPLTWAGPAPWYDPPVPLAELPPVDVVLISHDHYDHLQEPTIRAMAGWDTTFVAPLGVGAHLEAWGVPADRIRELDWWEQVQVAGLTLVATPARHASGRQAFDQNRTLWAGWALLGPTHRVFFSGDTGLFPALPEIGEKLGPFDVTMVEVGAYDRTWPDWHLGPEQAVRAHVELQGKVMLPVHWGLWNLANHGWTEPAERVRAEAARRGVTVAYPRPGEGFEPAVAVPTAPWWPQVPWKTGEEDPIVATKVPGEGTAR